MLLEILLSFQVVNEIKETKENKQVRIATPYKDR